MSYVSLLKKNSSQVKLFSIARPTASHGKRLLVGISRTALPETPGFVQGVGICANAVVMTNISTLISCLTHGVTFACALY